MNVRNSYIGQAWLVIVLGLVFGVALAGVQVQLSPLVETNKLNETKGRIPSLVSGAWTSEKEVIAGYDVYCAKDKAGRLAGWVIRASGQGFADKIELLVGLDATAQTITGLYVLDQKETPGLGNKISEEKFRKPFAEGTLRTDRELKVTKGKAREPSGVPAVSGATISSESVCAIVNEAVGKVREQLAARAR